MIAWSVIFLASEVFSCKIFNTQKLKITDPYLKSCRYYLEYPRLLGSRLYFRYNMEKQPLQLSPGSLPEGRV